MVYINSLDLTSNNKDIFGNVSVSQRKAQIALRFDYNVNTEQCVTTTSGTGAITQTNNQAYLNVAAGGAGNALLVSKRSLAYQPGSANEFVWTMRIPQPTYGAGQSIYVGCGNVAAGAVNNDGFFFGYVPFVSGNNFAVCRSRGGAMIESIPQSSWNIDKMDGTGPSSQTLTVTNLNVYRIMYQWLGVGIIKFEIENKTTGGFQTVHEIRYANTYTDVSAFNPYFNFVVSVINNAFESTVTPLSVYLPCASAYLGNFEWGYTGLLQSISGANTVSTEGVLVIIQNKTTYASKTNRAMSLIKSISMSCDGTKNVIFRLRLNCTLSSTSYSDISTNTSFTSYSTTAATVSSPGRLLSAYTVGKVDNLTVHNLEPLNIILYPGDTLAITASSGANTDAIAAISWIENL